jgi:hypothetical protein
VIDPARRVAAAARVDHASVVQFEQERVMRIVRVAVRSSSAASAETRRPRYSTMSAPLRIVRVANTPRPWIGELRTANAGFFFAGAFFARAWPRA